MGRTRGMLQRLKDFDTSKEITEDDLSLLQSAMEDKFQLAPIAGKLIVKCLDRDKAEEMLLNFIKNDDLKVVKVSIDILESLIDLGSIETDSIDLVRAYMNKILGSIDEAYNILRFDYSSRLDFKFNRILRKISKQKFWSCVFGNWAFDQLRKIYSKYLHSHDLKRVKPLVCILINSDLQTIQLLISDINQMQMCDTFEICIKEGLKREVDSEVFNLFINLLGALLKRDCKWSRYVASKLIKHYGHYLKG